MEQQLTVATIKEAQKKAYRGPRDSFIKGAPHWMPTQPKPRKRKK